eukprot:gene5530-6215_t
MSSKQTVYKNSEVINRVYERASSSLSEAAKLTQSIVKNSKTKDIIHQSTKHFVSLDNSLTNIDQNLNNIGKSVERMNSQSNEALAM